jgi:hypothetical protein
MYYLDELQASQFSQSSCTPLSSGEEIFDTLLYFARKFFSLRSLSVSCFSNIAIFVTRQL